MIFYWTFPIVHWFWSHNKAENRYLLLCMLTISWCAFYGLSHLSHISVIIRNFTFGTQLCKTHSRPDARTHEVGENLYFSGGPSNVARVHILQLIYGSWRTTVLMCHHTTLHHSSSLVIMAQERPLVLCMNEMHTVLDQHNLVENGLEWTGYEK